MHICGPESRYEYDAKRIYTPPDALLTDYLHLAKTLGLERVVFVQPSVYGTDNTAMLEAMKQCPLQNRGVVVLDETVSDADLDGLNRAGVRGVRFNLVDVADARGPDRVDRAAFALVVDDGDAVVPGSPAHGHGLGRDAALLAGDEQAD